MQLLSDYIIIGFAATVGHVVAMTIISMVNVLLFMLFGPKSDDS